MGMAPPDSATGDSGGGGLRSYLAPTLLAAAAALCSRWLTNSAEQDSPSSDAIHHALAGALGSALSITLLYPLETVRTRVQVDDSSKSPRPSLLLAYDIGRREGAGGLYKGWRSLVVALMALNFVYFYGFRVTRRWVGEWAMRSEDGLGGEGDGLGVPKVVVDLIAGYLAGCAAVLATGPLWLVNTRLKLQGVAVGKSNNAKRKEANGTINNQYDGILHCLCSISKEEGALALWRGTIASLVLAWNPAIQLGVYELLKRRHFLLGDGIQSASLEHFANALVAKFLATVATYPLQVLQTRHRAGMASMKGERDSSSRSWSDELWRLYRGLESKLLQTCLNSALMFVIYERLVDALRAAVR